MKKIKTADALVQSFLILALLVYCAINPFFKTVTAACLIITCWQALSMLLHVWAGWFTSPYGERKIYHRIIIACIASIPLGSLTILMFISPVLFGLYNYICYREVYAKLRRPLSLLK